MRPATRDKLLSLAALVAVAVHPLAPIGASRTVRDVATGASVALALAAWRAGEPVRSLTAMLACLALATELPVPWQALMLAAVVAFVVLARAVPALRPSPAWRAKGRVPLGWTALVGGVTPIALTAWVVLFRPDLRDVVPPGIDGTPLPLLVLGGFAFALVNATLEEVIWRGVLQDRLEPVFGAPQAIALQAASFGVQHFHGVPRGVVGVLLAGTWAVMLGVLRRHTRGLLAPVLAHIVADSVIAVIVLTYAR